MNAVLLSLTVILGFPHALSNSASSRATLAPDKEVLTRRAGHSMIRNWQLSVSWSDMNFTDHHESVGPFMYD